MGSNINVVVAFVSAFHIAYPDAEHRLAGRASYEEFLTRHAVALERLERIYGNEMMVSVARTAGRIAGQHLDQHMTYPNDLVLFGKVMAKHLTLDMGAVLEAYAE